MKRTVGLVCMVLLTLVAPLAEGVRDQTWERYRTYRSLFQDKPPVGPPPPAMTPRLVVVLVRGLRLEPSRRMPALNQLRARGADIILEQVPPTYRAAAETSWLSGALPAVHGVIAQATTDAPMPDTLLHRLSDQQRESVLVADAPVVERFESLVARAAVPDDPHPARRDSQAIALVLEMLRDANPPATFALVELTLLERVARESPNEYSSAVAATDFRLRELINALDLTNTTLVIAGDRGLTSQGSDGGGESVVVRVPWVMAGLGVAGQTQALASVAQFAPTLAVLAGVSLPVQAEDIPLFEALASNPAAMLAAARQVTAFYELWAETLGLPRFAAGLLRDHEADIAKGDRAALAAWRARLLAAVQRFTQQRLTEERLVRLPLSAGVGLGLLALALALARLQTWRSLALGGVAVLAAGAGLAVAYGWPPSLSLFRDAQPAELLTQLEWRAVALFLAVGGLMALLTGACKDVFEAAGQVMSGLALLAVWPALAVTWFYWQWGDAWSWVLPDGAALAAAQVALTALSALSIPPADAIPVELPLTVVAASAAVPLYGLARLRRRARARRTLHVD
ncbi:MAG: hypothetical protein ACK4WM_03570 [Thermoflexales bacterium]